MSKPTWDPTFGPCYSPEQMLKLGVFEGKYINALKGLPASWKKIDKVLNPTDEPDPKINKYGVKSRQPLSVWKDNGWIKTDKNGWFEWYCHYSQGRRIEDDAWQIKRWRSFVARHQGQINSDSKSKNADHRLAQKQALLQWGWNWEEKFDEAFIEKNANKLAGASGATLGLTVAKENRQLEPAWLHWN